MIRPDCVEGFAIACQPGGIALNPAGNCKLNFANLLWCGVEHGLADNRDERRQKKNILGSSQLNAISGKERERKRARERERELNEIK